jgi:cytochrome c
MTTSERRDAAGQRTLWNAASLMALGVVWTGASAQPPQDAEALANSKRCSACHTVEETLLGPPYRAIAARHVAERELNIEVLARKIVHGGGGNWGVVPLVPNEHVTLDEARAIAAWILSLND